MEYLCLVYVEERTLHAMPQSERVVLSDQSMAYCDELQKNGQLIGASPVHPVETATTVRVRGGKSQRPMVRDLNDAAVRIASKFPAAQYGSIEMRPIKEDGCA